MYEIVQRSVDAYQKKGFEISEETAEKIKIRCLRKMERNNVNPKYLPVFFEEELKDYLIGNIISGVSMAWMKGENVNVQNM